MALKKDNSNKSNTQWLKWASDLQALAQNGLSYTENPFDKDRYLALQKIALDMMTYQSHHQFQTLASIFEQEEGYATPKIDVRGAVFKGDTVLLVQERSDNLWTLPGGWCDINLSPAECVIKEIHEEAGFKAKVIKLVALCDKLKHDHPPQLPHAYKCLFNCEIISGVPTPSIETKDVQFFPLDRLPPLSKHRITQAQIKRCFEHWHNPQWPSDYD